jgi:GT2 family glycosyltransferase
MRVSSKAPRVPKATSSSAREPMSIEPQERSSPRAVGGDERRGARSNRITTVVPTYLRAATCAKCLDALERQVRRPDEVIVTIRDEDDEARELVRNYHGSLPLRVVMLERPGLVQALNAGTAAATGDIVAFTDDDAMPWPDWLQRIEACFDSDPRIAGVGGRDWMYVNGALQDGGAATVGKVSWFGRLVGNHHLGAGAARDVDVLKGVNCAYRASLLDTIRFDERTRGVGAQVHFEVFLGLCLRKMGYRLVYDPAIAVDHHLGKRHDIDQRDDFNFTARRHAVHNETVALLEFFSPARRAIFLTWAVLVGTREAFGLVQWLRFAAKRDTSASARLLAALAGRIDGCGTALRGRRPSVPRDCAPRDARPDTA